MGYQFLKSLDNFGYNFSVQVEDEIMKLKKINHNHKETENPVHKKSKSMPEDIEPVGIKVGPGGFFGRKWFNHKKKLTK